MPTNTKAIVEKVNAAFAQNNPQGFLTHCADDVVFTMVGDRTVKGKDAIRQWMSQMDSEPPRLSNQTIIAEGDFVSSSGDMTMKDKDGKMGSYAYSDHYRFRGDKIVELKAFVTRTDAQAAPAGV